MAEQFTQTHTLHFPILKKVFTLTFPLPLLLQFIFVSTLFCLPLPTPSVFLLLFSNLLLPPFPIY